MSVFDQIARRSLREDSEAFFRWLLPEFSAAYRFVRIVDTRTTPPPEESDRTCDIVAEFVHRSDPEDTRILNAEFQAEPDVDILERMGFYALRLRRDLRLGPGQVGKRRVHSVVINMTGPPQTELVEMSATGLGLGHRIHAVTITLRDMPARALLERIESGDLPRNLLVWIPLMQNGGEDDIIQQWLILAAQVPETNLRTEYGSMALVLSGLADRSDVWQDALKGWNVKESTLVKEWREEERVLTLRENLRLALETRLETELPNDVRLRIEGESSATTLQQWLRIALTTDSMESFRSALPSENGG